jgi:hypothetical protein
MRPDILLCSSNCKFLALSKGVLVAHNNVASLLRVASQKSKIDSSSPLSVQELHQPFHRVGMMHLLQISGVNSVSCSTRLKILFQRNIEACHVSCLCDGESNTHKLPEAIDPRHFEEDRVTIKGKNLSRIKERCKISGHDIDQYAYAIMIYHL